jgi:hypothetical protein
MKPAGKVRCNMAGTYRATAAKCESDRQQQLHGPLRYGGVTYPSMEAMDAAENGFPRSFMIIASSQGGRALLERAGGRQPANRRGIDGIGPRHIGHHLARSKAL